MLFECIVISNASQRHFISLEHNVELYVFHMFKLIVSELIGMFFSVKLKRSIMGRKKGLCVANIDRSILMNVASIRKHYCIGWTVPGLVTESGFSSHPLVSWCAFVVRCVVCKVTPGCLLSTRDSQVPGGTPEESSDSLAVSSVTAN